jgi:hypothetical protein
VTVDGRPVTVNSWRSRRAADLVKLLAACSGWRCSPRRARCTLCGGLAQLVPQPGIWVDDKAGKVFCLVEAPDADAAHTVHREAHGLVADEIYPVVQG